MAAGGRQLLRLGAGPDGAGARGGGPEMIQKARYRSRKDRRLKIGEAPAGWPEAPFGTMGQDASPLHTVAPDASVMCRPVVSPWWTLGSHVGSHVGDGITCIVVHDVIKYSLYQYKINLS